MSQEGPKLLKNKPKKAQVIRASEAGGGSSKGASATSSVAPSSSSSVSAAAASYKMGSPPPPPPPPPQPPQESFARRYKFLWPLLLGVNLVVGVYYFTRTRNPIAGKDAEVTTNASPAAGATAAAPLDDKPAPVLEPVRIREPIPDIQQRDLFKWILDEKRKVKPKDPEEKKRLDEEKAILKQFIRAKSIPSL